MDALTRMRIAKGDITAQGVDAVVNAANPTLMGGGGVDGAIHRAGGPVILEQCLEIRRTGYPDGLPTGEAVATTGGNMRARHVIHTVGPVWRGGGHSEAELLRKAYLSCLRLAEEMGLRSIAFPSISTGAYGYPVEQASRVAVRAVRDFLEDGWGGEAVFVLFSEYDYRVYADALQGAA
ncbi:MAG: O-acetyl-ADP-ribose deacetylase [Candidatus Bathyarchaeota archaeon]